MIVWVFVGWIFLICQHHDSMSLHGNLDSTTICTFGFFRIILIIDPKCSLYFKEQFEVKGKYHLVRIYFVQYATSSILTSPIPNSHNALPTRPLPTASNGYFYWFCNNPDNRCVASLKVPDGLEFRFPHFALNVYNFFLIFKHSSYLKGHAYTPLKGKVMDLNTIVMTVVLFGQNTLFSRLVLPRSTTQM